LNFELLGRCLRPGLFAHTAQALTAAHPLAPHPAGIRANP
jgi:hypothetical protein